MNYHIVRSERRVNLRSHDGGDGLGPFAVVVGLLFWFFLLAEGDLVPHRTEFVLSFTLWPRGLKSVLRAQAVTDADKRACAYYPDREMHATDKQVRVDFVPEAEGDDSVQP